MTHIDPNIFRAYDIRGIVDESLTPETVYAIGQAIGSEALSQSETSVTIGRDGRLSGPALSKALAEGILSTGCHVTDIGAIPTPVLYFATHVLASRSGVMLTGSHNPPNYNGLKIVINGKTLANESIKHLYERIISNDMTKGQGQLKETNIIDSYIDRITSDIHVKKPLKIAVDCGNGIGGLIASKLYQSLNCEVHELFCEVDGNFPNHHPDPSELKNLKDLIEAVKQTHADIGLAFDGDGDRLGVITNQGQVIFPDRHLMLFAIDVLSRNPNANIIYDVKCTSHLAAIIKQHHGNPIMYKTGHSFVKAKMQETGALLGGEMSGHTFFKERWYGFDDALYTGARLLEILSASTKTSDELFDELPNSVNSPELRLPVSENEKFALMKKIRQETQFEQAKIITIDGIRVEFENGWGLIRPSNTTPYLILRFEAIDEKTLKHIQTLFKRELLKLSPDLAPELNTLFADL